MMPSMYSLFKLKIDIEFYQDSWPLRFPNLADIMNLKIQPKIIDLDALITLEHGYAYLGQCSWCLWWWGRQLQR